MQTVNNDIKNPTRRKLLQSVGAAAVATLVPAGSVLANNAGYAKAIDSGLTVEVESVRARYGDTDLLRVSISNSTNNVIQLNKISSAELNVDGCLYNLSAALRKGALKLKPNTVRHLWLRADEYNKPFNDVKVDPKNQLANMPVDILHDIKPSAVENIKAHVLIG